MGVEIETIVVGSTSELVAKVLEIDRQLPDGRTTWHRGHACGSHRLVSSLSRKFSSADEVLRAEQRLITRFRQMSLPYWPAGYPQNDWEQLFAMQHHGVPTRLLDWSENLFIALFFAAGSHEHTCDTPCSPVIWVFDPVGWNAQASQLKEFPVNHVITVESADLERYAPMENEGDLTRRYKQPLAIYGTHNSARIMAQRGTFTISGNSVDPMEDFAGDHSIPTLWRFELGYDRDEIRDDLSALGFGNSMVFPDLVGVSRELVVSEGLA